VTPRGVAFPPPLPQHVPLSISPRAPARLGSLPEQCAALQTAKASLLWASGPCV
jgi:hypothetical protein